METISDKLLCLDSKERFALDAGGGWKIAVDVENYDGYDVMA